MSEILGQSWVYIYIYSCCYSCYSFAVNSLTNSTHTHTVTLSLTDECVRNSIQPLQRQQQSSTKRQSGRFRISAVIVDECGTTRPSSSLLRPLFSY